ncbi:MAG: tetratricopeptide repeat protein [Deltaproteobacteria bacterium]|nr:tetratricopeptide repeat protein [Deltaproteobacteria bacterium]
MRETWGIAHRWACFAVLLVGLMGAVPAVAQQTPDDAAAREYFERGRVAFEQADYEGALAYFRHAYRLSHRGELQYNIGVAADRLQREEEALEAFEHYLDEPEVQERIIALRQSIAERRATELALEEATIRYQTPTHDGARVPTSAIVGSSALAVVGVAGVAAMSVGLAKNGSCSEEVAGQCVTERSATAWTWVYGALGVAALAGSATWLALSFKRAKEKRKTRVSVSPTGVMVSGTAGIMKSAIFSIC